MGVSVSEATRMLTLIALQHRQRVLCEASEGAYSNSGTYDALHVWGAGGVGRGISLEKSGDATFAHILNRTDPTPALMDRTG
jgi:hypothetical protein